MRVLLAPVGPEPKGGWTPLKAAEDVARRLKEAYKLDGKPVYGDDPDVWDEATVTARGWGGPAPAGVAWEGGEYEWAIEVSLWKADDYPGVFMEPYSGWLLYFYREES